MLFSLLHHAAVAAVPKLCAITVSLITKLLLLFAVAAAVTLSTVIHNLPHHGDAVVDAFKVGVILASYVMLCSSSS